jgi:hypothetical protein
MTPQLYRVTLNHNKTGKRVCAIGYHNTKADAEKRAKKINFYSPNANARVVKSTSRVNKMDMVQTL